jgi:glycosyltransferase involved in cell wall biosynthesis
MTAGLKVAVLFDTAGFQRSLPLTGAAARTLHLNAELAARGVDARLFLCDLNPQSRPVRTWPLPTTYVDYEALYADPRRLAATLSAFGPDLLVMSNSQLTARYGRELADEIGAALVYEMHDDEGALLRSLDQPADEWQQAGAEQSAAASSADGVIAFSPDDARAARAMTTGSVHVVPCGVATGPPSTPPREPVLSFVGNLFYSPNRRALDYLCGPAFTGHLAHLGASVEVYGRYPDDVRIDDATPVRLRGPVPYLREAIGKTMIGLAPLDAGGGMKLKVLEYMAVGIPVVGTAVAAAGFAEFDEFGLVGRDDLSDFPHLVARLLNDVDARRRLAANGRRLAETTYSWQRMARLAEEAYSAVLAASGPDRAARPALLDRYTGDRPYWLKEWVSQEAVATAADPPIDTGAEVGRLSDLGEATDCARVAAQSRTGVHFPRSGLAGYGGRSVVYLSGRTALKVYTHDGENRRIRETAGLAAVGSGLAGFQAPEHLAGDSPPGALSWIACRRIAGERAKPADVTDAGFADDLGLLLARLHQAPAELGGLRRFHRSPPDGTPDLHQVADRLTRLQEDGGEQDCAEGFVHGNFSARNILVAHGAISGIVDFERSGRGCPVHDVASAYLNDVLLGGMAGIRFLAAYSAARGTSREVDGHHLGRHLAEYAVWVLGWAAVVDPELAAQVVRLVPRLERWSMP